MLYCKKMEVGYKNMITLAMLYKSADNFGITINNFFVENVKAMAMQWQNQNHILLNESLIANEQEERLVLAEEIGHIECDCLYHYKDIFNPCQKMNIDKSELRAKKWAASTIIPLQQLKICIDKNMTLYEMAEFFDVPLNFLTQAIEFYKIKNQL